MGKRIGGRVRAFRRAPDGSAFENCKNCGVLVAVAIADMHECAAKKGVKRLKGELNRAGIIEEKRFDLKAQPRSAFRFYMESFVQSNEAMNQIEADIKGFETWRNMSKLERLPYILKAEKVNSDYDKALIQEVEDILRVNQEADSAEVGMFDKKFDNSPCFDELDGLESFRLGTGESFYSYY